MNYYNEHDARAAQWMRNLIDAGTIPRGEVDCRDLQEVQADDLRQFSQCHFFAGIAGWSLALDLAGIPADFPLWTGSCPCQPFSAAGKRKGKDDERHLWPCWFDLIRECRPQLVFGEQSADAIRHGWIDDLQADMEGEGYACGYAVLGAHSVGAPHKRQRLYWGAVLGDRIATVAESYRLELRGVASTGEQSLHEQGGGVGGMEYTPSDGRNERGAESSRGSIASGCTLGDVANTSGEGLAGLPLKSAWQEQPSVERSSHPDGSAGPELIVAYCRDGKFRPVSLESGNEPVAYGIPAKVERLLPRLEGMGLDSKSARRVIRTARSFRTASLRGYGNAIAPGLAAEFIAAFMGSIRRIIETTP